MLRTLFRRATPAAATRTSNTCFPYLEEVLMREESFGKLTRRDFARASAIGGFAVLAAREAKAETNADTLTYGLIGCGGRGTGAARNAIDGVENMKLVALADIFDDQLKKSRAELEKMKNPKVDIKDDMCFVGPDAYAKLIATDVDVVILAATPYCRPVHFEAAVNAGKQIFTEKPIATDAAGVRRFLAAAKKSEELGLSVVAGTQRRHQKSYVETVKRLQDGEIGEILAARAYWCGSIPFVRERKPEYSDLEYRLRNWYAYCWVCGDNIVEQHIHNMDVINWVLGMHPVKAFGLGGRTWKTPEEKFGDHWDNFAVDYEYPNGLHVMSLSRHWNKSDSDVSEAVVGTKGTSNCRDLAKDDMDPYVQEHINLAASIRKTGPHLNEAVQVAESTFTMILGREAAYSGKTLSWDKYLAEGGQITPDTLDFSAAYPVRAVPIPGTYKPA